MTSDGLLAGKNAVVFGVANKHSIAWAIAEAFASEGAQVGLSYAVPQLARRVQPLADKIAAPVVIECDVTSDEAIERAFAAFSAEFTHIDILIHAVAFAEREELNDYFYNTSRDGFKLALDVSAYSLTALTRAAMPLMPATGASIITLSYYGAEKVVAHYNVMGVAKAALEASVRYLAAELGARNIRVNALSPGPIKTLSSAGFGGFRDMLAYSAETTPLRRNVTQAEVAQSAVYLASEMASGVTGEVIHVDAGYNILGVPDPRTKD